MRKQTIIGMLIVIMMSFILSSCTGVINELTENNSDITAAAAPVTSEAVAPTLTNQTVRAYGDRQYYSTIKEIADKCDHIIIGKVEKTLPVVRIPLSPPDSEHVIYGNYIPFHILIEKTIKGNKKEGDYIDIVQNGTYTIVTENKITESVTKEVEDVIYMEEGAEYLLFVRGEDNVGKDLPYYYYLPSPDQGYCRIIDGKFAPDSIYNLLKKDMSVDEAVKQIEQSQKTDTEKK